MLFRKSLHTVQTSTPATFQSTDFRQTSTRFNSVFWSTARQLHIVFFVAFGGRCHQVVNDVQVTQVHSEFSSLCISCVARNIESALGLGHPDGFICSHTTIRFVLSNSSENHNPNSTRFSDFGTEGVVTFSSNTSPSLTC